MTRVPLALVLGGGGWFGIGYHLGVLDGLRECKVPVDAAPMLGTSAGSWAASATALSVPFDELAALPTSRWPDPRPGVLERAARLVFGDATAPGVSVVACALPRLGRVVLRGDQHPLAGLVAASSAVPGLLAPQRIAGTPYVDGGVRSASSVDLAPAADLLVVVAPMAGRSAGGRHFAGGTRREAHQWEGTHGGRVVVITPPDHLAARARLPHRFFDRDLARIAYDEGRKQAESHSGLATAAPAGAARTAASTVAGADR